MRAKSWSASWKCVASRALWMKNQYVSVASFYLSIQKKQHFVSIYYFALASASFFHFRASQFEKWKKSPGWDTEILVKLWLHKHCLWLPLFDKCPSHDNLWDELWTLWFGKFGKFESRNCWFKWWEPLRTKEIQRLMVQNASMGWKFRLFSKKKSKDEIELLTEICWIIDGLDSSVFDSWIYNALETEWLAKDQVLAGETPFKPENIDCDIEIRFPPLKLPRIFLEKSHFQLVSVQKFYQVPHSFLRSILTRT
jgi:hypothetical protein